MSIIYHINTSYLRTTYTKGYTWRKSWWSRIHTANINDLITLTNKMEKDIYEEMYWVKRESSYTISDFKIIIAIIKQDNYESLDSDNNLEIVKENTEPNYALIIQQIYKDSRLPKTTDFDYNNSDIIVESYDLFDGDCYFDYKTVDSTNT